jgi:hypothetical protein
VRRAAAGAALLLAGVLLAPCARVDADPPPAPPPAYRVVETKGGGTIRGRCRLDGPVEAIAVRVKCSTPPRERPTPRVDVGEGFALGHCVVSLRDVPSGKDWSLEMRPDERSFLIVDTGDAYSPHVVCVRVGTQLGFRNDGPCEHCVHAYLGDSTSDSVFNFCLPRGVPKTDVGAAYLDRPGRYLLRDDCELAMDGHVHVMANPYFEVTSSASAGERAAGEYVLTDVPPGTYVLECWHAGMTGTAVTSDGRLVAYRYSPDAVLTRSVVVPPAPAGGGASAPVIVDFTIPAKP